MTTFNLPASAATILFFCLAFVPRSWAQTASEPCGSDILHRNALQDPAFQKKHEAFEQGVFQQIKKGLSAAKSDGAVVTLPVVVHIVHQNGAENISDAQVLLGIQQLNEAFANTGYYDQGSGVNTMIQFCLAKRSPDNLASNGITRDVNSLTNMTMETQDVALKNLNRWDPTQYVNIWLVREICSNGIGCGVAGYAYFPSAHGSSIDGIVMEANWLGSTPGNTGVLAHEMGHYLGLYHTFQGGCTNNNCLLDGDRVCDTPPDFSTAWVPCNAQVNTCTTDTQSGFATDQNDMILNFMDYTDFKCFHDFTPGQSTRMNTTITITRASLLNSKGCNDPCPVAPVVAAFTPASATIAIGQNVTFTNTSQNAASYTWLINGVPFAGTTNAGYTFPVEGVFVITLQANSSLPDECSADTATAIIQVVCPVVAEFQVSITNPPAGEAVTFTNTSQNATQFEWFIDGVSQGPVLGSHTFTQPGVYIVRLEAGNGFCKKSKFVYISVSDSCNNVTFQKTWGDNLNNQGIQTAVLADGNFLQACESAVNGSGTDIVFIKTAPNGAQIWQKSFGGAGNDGVRAVEPLPDGGWVLAGYSSSMGSNLDPLVVRFAADGAVLWQKIMITAQGIDYFTDVKRTKDGQLILSGGLQTSAGQSWSAYLAKLDAGNGNVLWSHLYDAPLTDFIQGVNEVASGGFVASGFTMSFGQNSSVINDGMLLRTDALGNLLWVKAYGTSSNEWLTNVFEMPDGTLMATGSTSGYNGATGGNFFEDGWLVKTAADGALLWSNIYYSDQNIDYGTMGVVRNNDGSLVWAANDPANIGASRPHFFKTDASGTLEWSRIYNGADQGRILDVAALPEGYLFIGYYVKNGAPDICLLKTDAAGFAGQCAETPHKMTVNSVQPLVVSGQLGTLQAPALQNANLAPGTVALPDAQQCLPDCIETPVPPCKSFQNTYGTSADERGIIGIEMPGGGYLLGGNINQSGEQDILITRTDANGEVIWSKQYGNANQPEITFDLQAKPDGGFFLSFTLGNPSDAAFAVCDAAGNVQFCRRIITPGGSLTDVFYDIIATSDGGYLAAGSFSPNDNTNWSAFFLKMDAAGATQWYRAWNNSGTDFVTGVRELPAGGYIASGYGNSYGLGGTHDGVAYRLDASGNLLWTKAYGTPTDGGFSDVAIAADGGFLFAAGLWNFNAGNYPEGGIVRTDANGNLLWAKLYRPSNNLDWETTGLVNTPDGHFVLAGRNRPNTGDTKAYLLKLDDTGQLLWTKQYGGAGEESVHDVRVLSSGSLLWTGRTTSAGSGSGDFYVLKTDADGHAGVCAETPHTTAAIPLQITETNGVLQELTPPVLQTLTLPLQPVVVAKTEICIPDCPDEPPCENTWIKTFSAPGMVQGGTNILAAADGNFFVSGFRNDSSLLMKMSPSGAPIWVRSFKLASGPAERISQIVEDSEGHIAGCGMFGQGALTGFIFRYNPATDQIDWVRENPTNPQSFCYNIQEKAAGGNFLVTWSHHNSPVPGSFDDANLVEINRNTGATAGTPYAYTTGSSESFLDLKQQAGFWYTVGRYTYGNSFGGMRASLGCFDPSGNQIWNRMLFFGPGATARNYASHFIFDGADMVTTVYGDFNGDTGPTRDIAVCKTDLSGSILWAKRYTLPLNQAFTKGIVSVPDGYIVLASNLDGAQPPSICLLKIDKNGNLLWAREFHGYQILRGQNLLASPGYAVYFTAQHLGSGDLAVAKIRVEDGRVGGDCPEPADITVLVADLPTISVQVNLLRYASPVTHTPRNAAPQARALKVTDVCIEICTPEICNNGLDDDGDNLFDCLDPDCDCHSCDGAETNIWYFGRQAGLNFTDNPPLVLTDGKTNTNEAAAVASDPFGRLIFYTDAKTVFQRNHLAMPNGSGLFGHTSSSQTLIVPHPGDPARFFVFTPDSYDNGPARGLSYSVVDMTLNNGFGDIPVGQKNLPLTPASELVEQLSAVRHCNGTDYWLLNHRKTTNAFLAYRIDQNGLNTTPVISNAGSGGPAPNGNYDVIGQMKIAPDGLHLARALYHTNGVEVFDFDAATGAVSNPVLLKAQGLINPYGVEFSPTGRYLYATGLGNPSSLFQFDLLAGDAVAIAASAVQLASFPGIYHYGQLQLARNGKIYTTNSGAGVFSTQLGVIHKPDEAGPGCLYQENGQTLAGTPGANLSLPNFLVSHFWKPAIYFEEANLVDTICQLPQVQTFSLKKLPCGIQTVDWKISGSGTITGQTNETVTVRFDQAGQATLVAQAISLCGDALDTLQITILEPDTAVLDLGPDRSVCENGVAELDAGPGFRKYRWFDGSTGQTTTTTTVPGKYWVDVWDNCGNKQTDTLEIKLIPATALDLGPDPAGCAGVEQTFQLPAPFTAWHWYPDDYLSCADCPTVVSNAPANTTYIIVGQSAGGCLSADTLTIQIVGDSAVSAVQVVTCPGEAAVWNGQSLLPGGPYPFPFTTVNGCDSTVMVTVVEIDSVLRFQQLVTCPGQTADWNGQPLSPGTYPFIFTAANGCDSTVLVTVIEIDSVLNHQQLVTCPGQTVDWNGQPLSPGTYPFMFTAANGCDSTVLVTVMEIDSVLSQVQLLTCPGEATVWNGQNLLPGGPYPFGFIAANGCDSTVLVTVIEVDTVLSYRELAACPGQAAVWNGQNLLPGGPYPFVYTAANGCDSTILVTVMEVDSVLNHRELAACPGQAAVWNGQNLLPGGPYPFVYTAANGCDSTVLVTVIEVDSVLIHRELSACPGQAAVWNGQNLLPGGPYPFVYTAANGCDSTVLVTVTEIDSVLSLVQLFTCPGEAALWNGQGLFPGGPYPFQFTAANGCDSTILVTVLVIDSVLNQVHLLACPGDTALWNGQPLLPGIYPFVFTAANGCDSTVLVTVEATYSVVNPIQLVACPGEPAVWNGQSLQPGGPYPFVFTAMNGCDSTVLVTVLEIDSVLSHVQLVTCPGEPAVWNGQSLQPGGPYPFVFTGANGCDSTVLVAVLEADSVLSQVQLLTCPGEPAVWNGQPLQPGGPYPFVFTGTNGCDSTVLVSVLEADSVLNQLQLGVCPGEKAVWNGQKLQPGGPYPFTFTGANGCDSTVLVTVVAQPGITIDLPQMALVGLGKSIQLTPIVLGEQPLQYSWTPADQLSCNTCAEPFASPDSNTWYILKVTDNRGCMASDSIWLRISPVCDVYLPNAFQPDEDGRNDWFYPQTASCVRLVRVLRVYSRWGELVFERRDFEPNEETLGWDGSFRQQDMTPGVFTWYGEFELTNGQQLLLSGDVTVVR